MGWGGESRGGEASFPTVWVGVGVRACVRACVRSGIFGHTCGLGASQHAMVGTAGWGGSRSFAPCLPRFKTPVVRVLAAPRPVSFVRAAMTEVGLCPPSLAVPRLVRRVSPCRQRLPAVPRRFANRRCFAVFRARIAAVSRRFANRRCLAAFRVSRLFARPSPPSCRGSRRRWRPPP